MSRTGERRRRRRGAGRPRRRRGSTPRAGRAGARRPGTPSPPPARRRRRSGSTSMRFRPGTPVAADGVQGEGLLVVDPGTGEPAALLRHRPPPNGADPARRRSRVTGWCVRSDGSRSTRRSTPTAARPRSRRTATSSARRDGRRSRRRRCGAPGTATSRRSPPPTSTENLRGLRRARPAGRRGADRRRLEPGARGGAAAVGAVRVAAGRGRRGPRHRAGAPGSGWRRSSVGARDHPRPRAPGLAGRAGRPQLGPAPRRPRPHPPRRPRPARGDAARGWSDLGVDYLKLDFLYAGAVPGPPPRRCRRRRGVPLRAGAGPRGRRARRLPRRLRRAAPAQRRPGRRDAGLARHLPRGRRGRLHRAARADAPGGPRVAAGPALGQRPRLRRGPAVVLPARAVGGGRSPATAGCGRSPTGSPSSTSGVSPRCATCWPTAAAPPRSPPDALRDGGRAGAGRGCVVTPRDRSARRPDRAATRAALPRRACRGRRGSWSRSPSATPARLRGRAVEPPTAPHRLPHHLRRRDPAAWRGAAAHAGGVPARPRRRRASATCTCCRCSRGPPTTASRSSTTGRSTRRSARWDDVAELAADHALMFDFVANHTSSSSPWFLGWLAGDPAYAGFYLEQDPDFDASRVVRPRTSPLFHPFPRPDGTTAWAWTTFGRGPGRRRRAPPRHAAAS